jgi:hypothetical protein
MRDRSKICKLKATGGFERGHFYQRIAAKFVCGNRELPNPRGLPPHLVGRLVLPQSDVDRVTQ